MLVKRLLVPQENSITNALALLGADGEVDYPALLSICSLDRAPDVTKAIVAAAIAAHPEKAAAFLALLPVQEEGEQWKNQEKRFLSPILGALESIQFLDQPIPASLEEAVAKLLGCAITHWECTELRGGGPRLAELTAVYVAGMDENPARKSSLASIFLGVVTTGQRFSTLFDVGRPYATALLPFGADLFGHLCHKTLARLPLLGAATNLANALK